MPLSSLHERLWLVLVVTLPMMQPLHISVSGFVVQPADFIFCAVVVLLVADVARGTRSFTLGPWQYSVIAYFLACTVSALASDDSRTSFVKLGGTGLLCGLGLAASHYAASDAGLRRTLTAWLTGTAITIAAAAAGTLMFYAGWTGASNLFLYPYGSLIPGPYPRVMALFLNANMLCTYSGASALIAVSTGRARWIPAGVAFTLFVGSLITAVLTLSPVLGGLALAVSLWWAATVRAHRPTAAAMLTAGGIGAAVAFFVATTLSPTMFVGGQSNWLIEPSSRVQTWTSAWHTFAAHPWLGKGHGLEVADVTYLNASGLIESLTDAHNVWLSIAAQNGVPGLMAFAVVVGLLVVRARPSVTEGAPMAVIRTGVQLALVAGLLYASLSGAFEDTRHLWVLMGLVAAAQARTT